VRALTTEERQVILLLAAEFNSDEERKQLLTDLDNCSVQETVPDGSMLAFDIADYRRPAESGRWQYRGKDGFPVEGVVKDTDGAEMEVMLLADTKHRVCELEIVRYHPGAVIKPDWRTFKVR
jgi:Domain of unknown function (DUF6984)